MIKVDNTQINKLFKDLQKNSTKIYNAAIKGYTGKLAFKTKQVAELKIQTRFKFKSNATLNRSKKKIAYTKPKIVAGKWQTEVGSTGDIKATSASKIGAFWLGRQELGEKVKQKKFKKASFRSHLMTRVVSAKMKPKQVKRISSSIVQAPTLTGAGLAIGIKKAKRTGKKYVGSKWGVYQVTRGKYKKGKRNAFKVYSYSNKSIKLKKRTWLKPATESVMKNYNKYALIEIDRAFKKYL